MEKYYRILNGARVEEHELQHRENMAKCPLRDEFGRTAVLAPSSRDDDMYEFIAVVDSIGVYPAKGFYDPEHNIWIFLGKNNYCPPSRMDAVEINIRAWDRAGIIKFARWCRNRAYEHSWIAADARLAVAGRDTNSAVVNTTTIVTYTAVSVTDAAVHATRVAVDDKRAAFNAANASIHLVDAAFYAAHAAVNAARVDVNAADAAARAQWNDIFEWIAEHDKKYRKKEGEN